MFDSATYYVNGYKLWSLRVSSVVLVCFCVVVVWSFKKRLSFVHISQGVKVKESGDANATLLLLNSSNS